MESIEDAREFWGRIAKQHGWYKEPFFVQVWVDQNGKIIDSISTINMDRDYVVPWEDGCDVEDCLDCGGL